MMIVAALAILMAKEGATKDHPRNGSFMLEVCGDYDGRDTSKSMTCLSYVAGYMDALSHYEATLEMMATFDRMMHWNIVARAGALPDYMKERLAKIVAEGGPWSAMAAKQLQLQADAATQRAALLEDAPIEPVYKQSVCLPDGLTGTGQLTLVILKYLREHPERLHEQAGTLTQDAIAAAFPCKKEGAQTAP
jgi:hypothetical protein